MDIENQRKRIDSLFLRLAAIYGHVWRSLYKSEEFLAFTKSEWSLALAKFDDSIVLDKALMNCLTNWEYPPTLPQYIECCKACSKQGQYEKYNLNSNPSSPEVAQMHLNKIKVILNIRLRQGDE